MMDSSAPLLTMNGVRKAYGGAPVLRGVDLSVRAGEVLALLGENGAGKSTLMKALGGAVAPDAGAIRIDGRPTRIDRPADARRAGVALIYQELNLVPPLTAVENLFLGRERSHAGFVRRGEERREAARLFAQLGVAVDLDTPCKRLSVAQQQAVEIAKALSQQARILVMDEPTTALTPGEAARLLDVVRDLQRRGIAVIYISHRLDEVYAVCGRALVLRDGANVGDVPLPATPRDHLIELMVGRPLDQEFPTRSVSISGPRLVVRGLRRLPRVRDVSFEVRRGEVLGLTGLVGAGRTETARLIFGADRRDAGAIELDGRPLTVSSPRAAIRAGICLLTEDRKAEGLIGGLSVRENFALPNLGRFSWAGFVRGRAERSALAKHTADLRIKAASPEQPARTLSGGNQQKVVLAKWLEGNAEVFIFDEPTRGVDVGAKYEIYQLINKLAAAGKAILLISSELPEVLGVCDRILVMHDGRITGELPAAGATQEQILKLAVE